MTTTLLATDESDCKSVATCSRRLEEARKEGKRWDGNFDFAFGFGGGETKVGTLKLWMWKFFENDFGSQPWTRTIAWRLCCVVPTKWIGMLYNEIRRERWRSWLRWPCAGKGTTTTTTWVWWMTLVPLLRTFLWVL